MSNPKKAIMTLFADYIWVRTWFWGTRDYMTPVLLQPWLLVRPPRTGSWSTVSVRPPLFFLRPLNFINEANNSSLWRQLRQARRSGATWRREAASSRGPAGPAVQHRSRAAHVVSGPSTATGHFASTLRDTNYGGNERVRNSR